MTKRTRLEDDLASLALPEGWHRPQLRTLEGEPLEFCLFKVDAFEDHVLLCGVTDDYPVKILASGYQTYFYCAAPNWFEQRHIEELREALALSLDCDATDITITIELRESMFGYTDQGRTPFLRIAASKRYHLRQIREQLRSYTLTVDSRPFGCTETFEFKMDFETRFLSDLQASDGSYGSGCSFMRVHPPYEVVNGFILVDYTQLQPLGHQGPYMRLPPFRITSIDIETEGLHPETGTLFQICCVTFVYPSRDPIHRVAFVMNACGPVENAEVYACTSTAQLLQLFAAHLRLVDPDVIIGYNTSGFDYNFIWKQAEQHEALEYLYRIGRAPRFDPTNHDRIIDKKKYYTSLEVRRFNSSAHGNTVKYDIAPMGVAVCDLQVHLRRDPIYKPRSYSLFNVCTDLLEGDNKDDIHWNQIAKLCRSGPVGNSIVAKYCAQDCILPVKITYVRNDWMNLAQQARVTGIPLDYLFIRGQQAKIIPMIARYGHEEGFIIPTIERDDDDGEGGEDEGYEGATVIDPVIGMYENVIVFDFGSLYPSIMRAHNLCFTTLIKDDRFLPGPEDYIKTPIGAHFVKSHVRRGLLPRIEDDLVDARSIAKKEKKKAEDAGDLPRAAALDALQTAHKLTGNSVYGITGVSFGPLACREVSASVTAFGRQMIQKVKEFVEENYTRAKHPELPADAKIIYGDTDSVFVYIKGLTRSLAFELAPKMEKAITALFVKPIVINFEKVLLTLILENKKHYAYVKEEPGKKPKSGVQGLVCKRRDNSPFVADLYATVLKILFYKHLKDPEAQRAIYLLSRGIDDDIIPDDINLVADVDAIVDSHANLTDLAIKYIHRQLALLHLGRIPLSQFIISRELKKEEYENAQVHAELVKRLKKAGRNTYQLGDRVSYIIVAGTKKSSVSERAYEPLEVMNKGMAVDTAYYLEKLRSPLDKLMAIVLGGEDRVYPVLYVGPHMMAKTIKTPTSGIAAFCKPVKLCVGCNTAAGRSICPSCEPQRDVIMDKYTKKLRYLEKVHKTTWDICRECKENGHCLVDIEDCLATDCKNFFPRRDINDRLVSFQKRL